jgi:hypothetical protein
LSSGAGEELEEDHRAVGIAAVRGPQGIIDAIEAVERAECDSGPVTQSELAAQACGQLGDFVDVLVMFAELVSLEPLDAPEYLPVARRLEGAFECDRVRGCAFARLLAAPGERRRKRTSAAQVAPVQGARRDAPLVDFRLELLRTLDVGPGRLQRPVLAGFQLTRSAVLSIRGRSMS